MKSENYWNENGKHQTTYDAQWGELIPKTGKAGTMQGEVLRAAYRLYHRWHNDGERIAFGGERTESCAENAWGFLFGAYKLLEDGSAGKDDANRISLLSVEAGMADDGATYAEVLERIMDAAILYAATRPLVKCDEDFFANSWSDLCVERCELKVVYEGGE